MKHPTKYAVLFAPPGIGKTQHSAAIAATLELQHIEDDWDGHTALKEDTLHLTNIRPQIQNHESKMIIQITVPPTIPRKDVVELVHWVQNQMIENPDTYPNLPGTKIRTIID